MGLLLVGLLAIPGLAQTGSKFPIPEQRPLDLPQSEEAVSSSQSELSNLQKLETFIDSILEEELTKSTIPDGVVSIVKDYSLPLLESARVSILIGATVSAAPYERYTQSN